DPKEPLVERFSLIRMLREFEAQGGDKVPPEGDEGRTRLLDRLKAALPAWTRASAAVGGEWERIRMLHAKLRPGGDEAEILSQVTLGGSRSRFRFWMIREGDDWKVFDFETLDGGLRFSVSVVALSATMEKDAEARKSMHQAFAALLAAFRQLTSGEFEEARKSLAGARKAEPPAQVRGWIDLLDAQALASLERYDESLEAADRALGAQKDLALAHQLKGLAYAALEKHEEAIAAEREFIKLVGDDAEAWLAIGEEFEKLGKAGEALEAFRKGAASDDEDFACRLNLGRLLVEGGRGEEARANLLAASRLAAPGEGVFEEAAELLAGAGDHPGVLELAQERVKRTPADPTVLLWQGRSLRRLGRLEEAQEVLGRAVKAEKEKDEDSSECAEELVFALAQAGKGPEALERAGSLAVGDGDSARFVRLFLHAMAGRTEKGAQELKALLEEDDEAVDRILGEPALTAFAKRDEVQKVLGPARARREFERAVEKCLKGDWEGLLKLSRDRGQAAPDDDRALYYQGYALRRLRRFGEAVEALRAAAGKAKEPREAREELGRALAALGQVDGALAQAEAILPEGKARGLSLRTAVFWIAGKPDQAVSALRDLLKEDPHWHEVVEKDADLVEFRKLPAVRDELKRAKDSE
ncbi:MAG TPA: tetratricopeptide repeat protein, partial [Planctomycetota bacterium]|nr:tetratricopeptide repeat protein [Planctomycetota bacterium]